MFGLGAYSLFIACEKYCVLEIYTVEIIHKDKLNFTQSNP